MSDIFACVHDCTEVVFGMPETVSTQDAEAYSINGGDSLVVHVESRPSPSLADLLRAAADETTLLALRMHAADRAACTLRGELELKCLAVFHDFYWLNSHEDEPFHGACASSVRVEFPQARKMQPDSELTPERDEALRALGFTHLGDTQLGLCTAEKALRTR